jgi:hypothetical protein
VVSHQLRWACSRRARRRKSPIRRAPGHTASGSRDLAVGEGHGRHVDLVPLASADGLAVVQHPPSATMRADAGKQ